jgi:hypothetical protein
MRAEARAGELLAQMKVRGERRQERTNKQNLKHHRRSTEATSDELPKLSDLGVTKQQSSRWQKFAALPAAHTRLPLASGVTEGKAER